MGVSLGARGSRALGPANRVALCRIGEPSGRDARAPSVRTPMKAEIISIGSELTSGQNLDTNSQWLSKRLAESGIPVGFHTTVADDLQDNIAVFRTATAPADLVLMTGGLGPT